MKFSDLGEDAESLHKEMSASRKEVLSGKGVTLIAPTSRGRDVLFTLARYLHRSKVLVHAMHLSELVQALRDEDKRFDLEGQKALFIDEFQGDGDCPLTNYQRFEVESFLLKFMDLNRPIFVRFSHEPKGKQQRWWSDTFMDRLKTQNIRFEVRK